MPTAHIHFALPGAVAGVPPDWVMLVPSGTFKGVDGRGPFHLRQPDAVIAASMKAGKLPLDENHSTDLAGRAGQPSPARGWIVEMQNRDGAIWGRIEWNPSGRELMADNAYRGISPVFSADRGGVVQLVMRAALTNNPNLDVLPTLHNQEQPMDLADLRRSLGLPETADLADCVKAAGAAHASVQTHAADLARIATAAGAAKPDAGEIVTVLNTAKTSGVTVERMSAELVALTTELNTLKTQGARDKAVAFVDGAIKDGKPIPSVLRDHFITRHVADAAGVEKELAAMPSLHAGGMGADGKPRGGRVVKHDADDGEGELMSAEDMEVCRRMGMDPKAMAKQRKMDRERAAEGSMT